VVVSAALCVAMAIMVLSFRASLAEWLGGVVGADLYARPAEAGDTAWFSPDEERKVAALPGVRSVEPIRYERIAIDARAPALTLVARPITDRVLAAFGATPRGRPAAPPVPVWISEAARDLHRWNAGDEIDLPLEGRAVRVRVAGVIRDYGRTWGSMLMPLEEYRRITGDTRSHNLAIHLDPGADRAAVQGAVRAALGRAGSLQVEDSGSIRERSIAIFDRTFAVTYAMEAIAVVIGMAGITSSFAALAWARRREFGVLRFLGLRRRDVLRLLALEGTAAGALGAAIGLVAGVAMSGVLVQVINRQSFHWTIELHWPWLALTVLCATVVATCALGARISGALAVRHEAILAVKDDA
jgi:putative ABC transport system permease protein